MPLSCSLVIDFLPQRRHFFANAQGTTHIVMSASGRISGTHT